MQKLSEQQLLVHQISYIIVYQMAGLYVVVKYVNIVMEQRINIYC